MECSILLFFFFSFSREGWLVSLCGCYHYSFTLHSLIEAKTIVNFRHSLDKKYLLFISHLLEHMITFLIFFFLLFKDVKNMSKRCTFNFRIRSFPSIFAFSYFHLKDVAILKNMTASIPL